MDSGKVVAVSGNELPWEERPKPAGKRTYRKDFFSDPETGMEVRLVRYPAGYMGPPHRHHCGHGVYVVEGTLRTHEGLHGPGSFVWFPEGEWMEHGATADGDVTVVFITNKPFEIHYE
jgi:quercetin dioxygenase-like cupin family protein